VLAAISYDPILRIGFGPLSISPHGIGIAIGFLIGARLMLPASRAKGMADEIVYPLFTRAAIGAIIGARVAYVVNHLGDYDSVLEVLSVWEGGISLLGGMFGAVIAALPLIRKSRLSFWKVMDAAAPGMALGVLVGRIGDLIIADHLGKTTDFFLGYRCPPAGVITGSPCAGPGLIVHQTALYDQMFAAILLVTLLWLRRRQRFDGFLICAFAAGYGVARLIEDFLREDLRRLGLTSSQWTALATLSVCLYVLVVLRRSPRWGHWDVVPVGVAANPLASGTVAVPATDADRPALDPERSSLSNRPGASEDPSRGPAPDHKAPERST